MSGGARVPSPVRICAEPACRRRSRRSAMVAPVAAIAQRAGRRSTSAPSSRRHERAERHEQLDLLGAAHDVDEGDAVGGAQISTSICPRFDAAAVCTIRRCGPRRASSRRRLSAVIGLMNNAAPLGGADVVGQLDDSGRVGDAVVSPHRPAERATRRPISVAASGPAATTVPAPSLPTGSGLSSRSRYSGSAASGTIPTRSGPSGCSVPGATAPSSMPRSEGLIGEASTATTTSLPPGSGTSRSASSSRSSPLDEMVDRRLRPRVGVASGSVMRGLSSRRSQPTERGDRFLVVAKAITRRVAARLRKRSWPRYSFPRKARPASRAPGCRCDNRIRSRPAVAIRCKRSRLTPMRAEGA